MSSTKPSLDELKKRATAIIPLIKEHQAQSNKQRDLVPEIVDALRKAELFKLYQPSAWGGFELDPRDFFDIQNILAEACASTAWIHGVLSVQSFLLALFDQQAQTDVWGDDPNTLMSSSFQPLGKIERTDGGYNISGRWTFSSGSSHAQWALLGGMVPPATEGLPPEMRLFLVPRNDYNIIDTWHTLGLRGTGSNDIAVEKAFVPAYRTLQPSAGMVPTVPASGESAPLYQLPWLYIFTGGVSNFSIGAARGALKAFVKVEKTRVSVMGQKSKEDPSVLSVLSRLTSEIQFSDSMYKSHLARMTDHIKNNEPMALSDGLLQRTQLTSVVRKLTVLVDEMQLLLGGRGIREDSPLTQVWLDLSAARAHPGNDPRAMEAAYGQAMLNTP